MTAAPKLLMTLCITILPTEIKLCCNMLGTATADQILPMIQADLGIGFIPEAFLTGAEHICVIDTEAPLPEREIRIVRRRDQPLSIAAQRLYRLILDLARE